MDYQLLFPSKVHWWLRYPILYKLSCNWWNICILYCVFYYSLLIICPYILSFTFRNLADKKLHDYFFSLNDGTFDNTVFAGVDIVHPEMNFLTWKNAPQITSLPLYLFYKDGELKVQVSHQGVEETTFNYMTYYLNNGSLIFQLWVILYEAWAGIIESLNLNSMRSLKTWCSAALDQHEKIVYVRSSYNPHI